MPPHPLPILPEDPTPEEEEAYFEAFTEQVHWLADAGGERMAEMEKRIQESTRRREKNQVSPTMLFHFMPG